LKLEAIKVRSGEFLKNEVEKKRVKGPVRQKKGSNKSVFSMGKLQRQEGGRTVVKRPRRHTLKKKGFGTTSSRKNPGEVKAEGARRKKRG